MFKDSKIIGTLLVTFIAIIIGLLKPFSGLGPQGHLILASVIVALGLWIFKPGGVPFMAGSAFLVGSGLLFGLKYTTVVSGFVNSALWILIPALYFGFALQKTGLGKRVAYLVLKSFKPSWASIALSWFIIGVILSALTPSTTVRVAIIMPIALGVIDACKLEYRSKGSAYIAIVAFAMCLIPGCGWLTGSLSGPIFLGLTPPDLKHLVNFNSWFQILFVPWFIVTIVFAILAYFFMAPKEKIGITNDTFKQQYAQLGAISRPEIITMVVLIVTLILFATERVHGIPAASTALLALAILLLTGIIKAPEIGVGANWDIIVFFGVTISLVTIFSEAKIAAWINPILQPSLSALAPSPLLFMLVITFGIFLIRFIDVPWGLSTVALTSTLLVPMFNNFGIHPLVIMFAFLAGVNFFLLSYQQPWMLMAEGIISNKGWDSNHVLIGGLCYIAAVVITLLVCIPYWQMIGVIH
ncbi:MAG: SLC13 family permease [Syntrophomonadaceae bacterium]